MTWEEWTRAVYVTKDQFSVYLSIMKLDQGDSGGPLVKRVNGIVFQFGIVSKGFGCGSPMKAGIYTKVVNYIDWINKNIKQQ